MDYPSNGVWNIDGIEIDSSFESGNLGIHMIFFNPFEIIELENITGDGYKL